MRYIDIINYGKDKLKEAGVEDYKNDAWLLFEHIWKINRTGYFLKQMEENTSEDNLKLYKDYIEKRCSRVPLQHITGHQEFMGMDFVVSENTLIPRQETELLVEKTLEIAGECGREAKILDMCTGSGCIAISIAKGNRECSVTAADISEAALEVAGRNKEILEAENVVFMQSDMYENITESFDIIVSNPPYIKTEEIEKLEAEVRLYDPLIALDGREDGLYFYRELTKNAPRHLKKGGYLLYEIGYDQGESVSRLMSENGFEDVTVIKDYAMLDRIVFGRLPH